MAASLGGAVKHPLSNMTATKRNKRCMIIFLMKLGLKNRLSYFVNPKPGWSRFVRFYDLSRSTAIDHRG